MNIMQTREERDAERVARLVVKALQAIEVFPHDPEMIFDVPVTIMNPGAAETWLLLKKHYNGG